MKPQVLRICTLTGLDRWAVVSRLIRVWVEAQLKADEDGVLEGKTAAWLDILADCKGFAEAMIATGWLVSEDRGVRIAHFDEFVSKRAIRRMDKAEWVAGQRTAATVKALPGVDVCGPNVDGMATNQPAVQVQPEPMRGGGRRKKVLIPSPLFDRFWAAYPKREAKIDASNAFAELGVTEEVLQLMLAAIAKQSTNPRWRELNGRFIPLPATWLRGRRWEDEGTVAGGVGVGGGARVGGSPGQFSPRRGRSTLTPAPPPADHQGGGGSLF